MIDTIVAIPSSYIHVNGQYCCIQHLMQTSDGLRGYRAVWKIIRDRYHIIAPRYVMHVL